MLWWSDCLSGIHTADRIKVCAAEHGCNLPKAHALLKVTHPAVVGWATILSLFSGLHIQTGRQ